MSAAQSESLPSPQSCDLFVTEGLKVNQTAEVQVKKNRFLFAFRDFPSSLKPSLYFSSTVSLLIFNQSPELTSRTSSALFPQLSIQRYDSGPLSSEDLINPAVIEVSQETTTMNNEATILTLPVPEDGKVHIKFRLKDEVQMLLIRVSIVEQDLQCLLTLS